MRPGDLSTLAAGLAVSGLSPAARGVLLTLAAGSDAAGRVHMTAQRVAERSGYSLGHARRVLRDLVAGGFVEVQTIPGRANLWTVSGVSAGAPGGERPRSGGVAPAPTVSGSIPESKPRTRADRPGRSGRPASDPTPCTPYEQPDPTGATTLRAFLAGRTMAEAIAEVRRGSDVTESDSVAHAARSAVSELALAGHERAPDPVQALPALAG